MTASRWRRDATLVERRSNTLEARYPGRLHLRYDWREIGSSSVGASGSRLVGDGWGTASAVDCFAQLEAPVWRALDAAVTRARKSGNLRKSQVAPTAYRDGDGMCIASTAARGASGGKRTGDRGAPGVLPLQGTRTSHRR
jgi:hypothetical protein